MFKFTNETQFPYIQLFNIVKQLFHFD